jgi:hypothetical protein
MLILFQGCATNNSKKNNSKISKEVFGNFDQAPIPNEVPLISEMIFIVQPELESNLRNKFAKSIYLAVKKYKVEPQIMVALIDTESNFKYQTVSTTGDLSLGQLNVDVWNIEFKRLKLPLINKDLLINADQTYALEKMALILEILKARHAKKDRRWYARYHSNTNKYKMDYLRKIEIRMKILSLSKTIKSKTYASLNKTN